MAVATAPRPAHPATPKTPNPQKPSTPRRWLRAGLIACLLVGSFLLFRGATPKETASRLNPAASAVMAPIPAGPKFATSTIDQMWVGQWVLAQNPELSESGLRMQKGDGSRLDVVLLRPLDWLEEYGAGPGATIYLDLPELGAEGLAEVLSVDACPQIPPSPSPDCRVVTGRFTHESAKIIDLQIEGLPEPIGCTSNHPFWSEDRQDFVEAGDLNQGETLRTADDRLVHVVSITQRKTPETVYNLEVDTEHVYYVSDGGVLVHNACPPKVDWKKILPKNLPGKGIYEFVSSTGK